MKNKYITVFFLFNSVLSFCADDTLLHLVAKDEGSLFMGLDMVIGYPKENKMTGIFFELLLSQNRSIKLKSFQKQDLVESIILNQANKRGAHMLVKLRDYQGIDYNIFEITDKYEYPLVVATGKMLDDCKNGIHIVNALINSGASTKIKMLSHPETPILRDESIAAWLAIPGGPLLCLGDSAHWPGASFFKSQVHIGQHVVNRRQRTTQAQRIAQFGQGQVRLSIPQRSDLPTMRRSDHGLPSRILVERPDVSRLAPLQ